MDSPDIPAGKSPRRELQGPRPTPLKVRKDSHKIRKPPMAPQPAPQHHQAPPRAPVIIYTVSPKVIHANPNEFMTLVQRLTGPDSTCSSSSMLAASSSSASTAAFQDHGGGGGGAISPAARFASMEKIRSPEGKKPSPQVYHEMNMVEGVEISTEVERISPFTGILSPNPASLPPISPNFFFPPSSTDPNPLGFFPDLSPILHSNNKNYTEGSFLPSPSTFISPYTISPSIQSLDLFNNFFDL